MRFLLTLCLLGVVGVSSQCTPKTATQAIHAGTNLCDLVNTPTNFDVITGSAVTIPVPKWDPTNYPPGAVLDAVYLNAIVADYAPTGTYKVGSVGGAVGTVTVELAVPTTWSFFSNVDNKRIRKTNLNSLIGWGTVNNGAADAVPTGCINGHGNDYLGVPLQCVADYTVLGQSFSLRDYKYKFVSIDADDVGVDLPFDADYSQPNTFVDFASYDGTASNGFLVAASNAGAGVSGYEGTGTWGLTSAINDGLVATAIEGQVITTSSGPSISNNIVHHFYILFEVQYDYHVPSVTGDPQFAGFQGQSFQVHGAPDAYFALISAPSYYVNARFDYISTGSCTYNETACFTHPGTYMGMIYVGMKDANILIQAGPHSTGFAGILVNDKPMTPGDRSTLSGVSADSYIQVISKSKLILTLDNIMITVHNSDLFVNFDLALMDKELLATGSIAHTIPSGSTPSQVQHHLNKWYGTYNPLHGLIGQTWRNVQYQDKKLYQGDITEYQLDKIVDHTFLYCVYQA